MSEEKCSQDMGTESTHILGERTRSFRASATAGLCLELWLPPQGQEPFGLVP